MTSIGLICAIPQESRPLVRRLPGTGNLPLAGIPSWRFLAGRNTVTLMESGMGPANAAAAAAAMIESVGPDIILSIGFCGAVSRGIQVGELMVARRHYSYSSGTLHAEHDPDPLLTERLLQELAPSCRPGTFITTDIFTSKKIILPLIPDTIPLPALEMESAAVIRACRAAGIRFAALRAVTDDWTEDPAALVSRLLGQNLTMNGMRAATTLLGMPWRLPQLLRLARNARHAGDSLATALLKTLEKLP